MLRRRLCLPGGLDTTKCRAVSLLSAASVGDAGIAGPDLSALRLSGCVSVRNLQRRVNRTEESVGLRACEGGERHGIRWTAVAESDLQLT